VIRLLTESDIPAAMALKDAAGWNQTERDWQLLLRLQPDGCFGVEQDGRIVASATAFCYANDLAWIGMVLTLPEYRGRGLGNRVFLESVEFCRKRGTRCIKLDATAMGQPLYERAGFEGEYPVERWGGTATHEVLPTVPVAQLMSEAVREFASEDASAFGANRATLLQALREASDWTASVDGGYAMSRPGTKAHYFGPCVARDSSTARELLAAFLVSHAGSPVFLDVPATNEPARELLRGFGFEVKRTLLRMSLGPNDRPGEPRRIFGLAGFEYG